MMLYVCIEITSLPTYIAKPKPKVISPSGLKGIIVGAKQDVKCSLFVCYNRIMYGRLLAVYLQK